MTIALAEPVRADDESAEVFHARRVRYFQFWNRIGLTKLDRLQLVRQGIDTLEKVAALGKDRGTVDLRFVNREVIGRAIAELAAAGASTQRRARGAVHAKAAAESKERARKLRRWEDPGTVRDPASGVEIAHGKRDTGTMERQAQGGLVEIDAARIDSGLHAGTIVSRATDTLDRMKRADTIDDDQLAAARRFQATFVRSKLDPLRAANYGPRSSKGQREEVAASIAAAKEQVGRAIMALGGIGSLPGAIVYAVVGEGKTIEEWCSEYRFATRRPLNVTAARGVLVAALDILRAKFGIGVVNDSGYRRTRAVHNVGPVTAAEKRSLIPGELQREQGRITGRLASRVKVKAED
jgi:hypothetical protein